MEHDAIFEEKNTENFTDTLDKIVKEGARNAHYFYAIRAILRREITACTHKQDKGV